MASGNTVILKQHGRGTFSAAFRDRTTWNEIEPTSYEEEFALLVIFELNDEGKIATETWYWYWQDWPVRPW